MPNKCVLLCTGLLLSAWAATAQTPALDPKLRATMDSAIQQARSLRKTQESLSAAVTDGKATPAMLAAQIAASEKSFESLRDLIDQIDVNYDSLDETRKSAVREAWSLAKIFSVLFEGLKASAAKPVSPEQNRDLLSDVTSTSRRAVMLDETLSRLNIDPRPGRGSTS